MRGRGRGRGTKVRRLAVVPAPERAHVRGRSADAGSGAPRKGRKRVGRPRLPHRAELKLRLVVLLQLAAHVTNLLKD